MARATKPVAPLLITVRKDAKGEGVIDALTVPAVKASELFAAGGIMQALCLNMLAGQLDPEIAEAVSIKGGIARLFNGKLSDPDVAALKAVTKLPPEALRDNWAHYVGRSKRIRNISLQALRKACNDEPAAPRVSLGDTLKAWCESNAGAAKKLPQDLFDILVDFSIIVTDE